MAQDTLIWACFVGFVVHTLLEGLFLSVAALCLYSIVRRNSRAAPKPRNNYVLAGIVALILVVTAHWALSLTHILTAIFEHEVAEWSAYITNVRNPLFSAKLVSMCVVVGITDMLIIYRLYIVWQDRVAAVVVPATLFTGLIAMKIVSAKMYLSVSLSSEVPSNRSALNVQYKAPPMTTVFDPRLRPAFLGMLILEVTFNFCCTSMISWQIWRAGRWAARVGGPCLSESFVIFIESAATYLTLVTVMLATYVRSHPTFALLLDCVAEVAAITYMLIHVRVSLGIAREGTAGRPIRTLRFAAVDGIVDAAVTADSIDIGRDGVLAKDKGVLAKDKGALATPASTTDSTSSSASACP
ncbi:hypothetical protein HDZ31DRAFT_60000 [Schizophyllum fasciatum]